MAAKRWKISTHTPDLWFYSRGANVISPSRYVNVVGCNFDLRMKKSCAKFAYAFQLSRLKTLKMVELLES